MASVFISFTLPIFCEAQKTALENWGEMVYLGEDSGDCEVVGRRSAILWRIN